MIWIAAAQAATLVVGPSAPYATFADALPVAVSGDTIQFAAGTHTVCADLGGRSLTLTSEEGAVLDGGGCGPVLTIQYGESVTLRGLTLRNTGYRLITLTWSTLTLEDVTLSGGGNASDYGGAIYAYGATLHTSSVTATGNVSPYGGALFFDAYNVWTDTGSTFTGNSASNGGAVYSNWDNDITLSGTVFSANSADYGGAVTLSWYGAPTFTDVVFEDNTATGNGGGLYVYALDEVLTLERTGFTNNSAGGYGGGVEIEWYTEVVVRDSVFTNNSSGYAGGAGFAYVADRVNVSRSTFCQNESAAGGAWASQWLADDTFTNNQFIENVASQGGAIHRYATYAGTFRHNTLLDNEATQGAAVYHSYAWSELSHNIFANSGGPAMWTADGQSHNHSPLTWDGWDGNDPVDAGGYSWADPDDGNVWGDPTFVAAGGCEADLRLATGSPMRNAGAEDCLDLDGQRCDLGAFGGTDLDVTDDDGDGADTTTDCDDTNISVHPGADEWCNSLDDDCDGEVDGDVEGATGWYADMDADGHGSGAAVMACEAPEGHVEAGDDCDDADGRTYPGAVEIIADGLDQDCDGVDTPLEAADTGSAKPDDDEEDGGCGCATGGGAPALLGTLALLALRRRQR